MLSNKSKYGISYKAAEREYQALPWQLKLHVFDYTVITYEQISSQSRNKQHYAQDDNGHYHDV